MTINFLTIAHIQSMVFDGVKSNRFLVFFLKKIKILIFPRKSPDCLTTSPKKRNEPETPATEI